MHLSAAHILAASAILLTACVGPWTGTTSAPGKRSTTAEQSLPESAFADPIEILDTWDGPSFAELLGVTTWNDKVAFCSGVQGLNLYDAADPTDLKLLDKLSFSSGSVMFPRCQNVTVDPGGTRLYVSNHGDQIQPDPFIAVVRADDPTTLEETWVYPRSESIEGLAVAGDLLLAAAHQEGLIVFRIGEAGDLSELSRLPLDNAWQVAVSGTTAWVANGSAGLAAVDLADPAAPRLAGALDLRGAAKDIVLRDDRAFLALGSAGVAAVDISDPAAPVLIDRVNTPGSALAVDTGPGVLYASDWSSLRVFATTDPDRLVPLAHEPLATNRQADSRSLGLAAAGTLLFSANWTELVSYRYHPERSAPDLEISPRPLLFPRTPQGELAEAVLFLENTGAEPLVIHKVQASASLRMGAAPERLLPGESAPLDVAFEAVLARPYSGWVRVFSDDPDQGVFEVPVTANRRGKSIGELPPKGRFTDLAGSPVELDALRGQVVLLAYFATF